MIAENTRVSIVPHQLRKDIDENFRDGRTIDPKTETIHSLHVNPNCDEVEIISHYADSVE